MTADAARPRIALNLQRFPPEDIHRLVQVAQYAESRGIDDLTLSEHVVMSVDQQANPSQAHTYDEPFPEPMVAFGALAAATQRV